MTNHGNPFDPGPGGRQVVGAAEAVAELDRRLAAWRPDRIGTLMFLQRRGEVLLIRKRRGHGAGKINGPGGKPEPGETPLQCVLRETAEEVGITVQEPRLAAVLRFVDTLDLDWLGAVFVASRFQGVPRPSPEALPGWFPLGELPFDEMWADDRFWLPRVLAGECLRGDFLFAAGRLLAHRLWPVVAPAAAPGAASGAARAAPGAVQAVLEAAYRDLGGDKV